MSSETIPDDIRRFILAQIPSVPYLEALLLLRGDPGGAWDRARVAHHLYLNEAACGTLLDQLLGNGVAVIAQDGDDAGPLRLRYHPSSPALALTIDQLAQVYAKHLVAVTHLIHARPSRKAQRLADAFVWRKET